MSKFLNRSLTLVLNAVVMGVVVLIIKTQDDLKYGPQADSIVQYNNLIAANKVIAADRTNKINDILGLVRSGQLATSTAANNPPNNPISKPTSPKASSPSPSRTPVVNIPAPTPVVTIPAPTPEAQISQPAPTVITPSQNFIMPNRTTRTS